MRRDGITAKPPGGIGERAWWLEEILAHAPLPAEAQRFVALTAPDDWAATVHRGLARAAAAQRDPVWAAALLDRLGDGPRDRAIAVSLYPVLDPGHLINRALAALTEGATARWSQLLGACPAPWPEELGRAALDGLATMAERPNMAGELYHLSRLAAVRMPVSLAASARELAPHHAGLTTFAAVLSYRYEMTQEMLS
jgi:hypothetical protein